jgi:hypothetical protein
MFLFPALLNPAAPAGVRDVRRYALHAPVCNGFLRTFAKWACRDLSGKVAGRQLSAPKPFGPRAVPGS